MGQSLITSISRAETEADSAYKKLDDELIRQYPDYWRADAPGLKAGKYMFKVEAVTDCTTASMVTPAVEVMSYDRSGYGLSTEHHRCI